MNSDPSRRLTSWQLWQLSLTALALVASGCASTERAHSYFFWAGEVLSVSDAKVSLNLGSQDGAQEGQELEMFRLIRRHPSGTRRTIVTRVKSGVIRIEAVLGPHRALAEVVSGTVRKGTVAVPLGGENHLELARP